MLNYNLLRKEFSKKLQQFDKNQLEKWIKFDQDRILFERLLSCDMIVINPDTISPSRLYDERESIDEQYDIKFAYAA